MIKTKVERKVFSRCNIGRLGLVGGETHRDRVGRQPDKIS